MAVLTAPEIIASPCFFFFWLSFRCIRPFVVSVASWPIVGLFLSQRFPDIGAQMDERFLIHHVLDLLKAVPVMRVAIGPDVEYFLDAAGAAGHDDHAIGEIYRFLDGMGNEQYGAR